MALPEWPGDLPPLLGQLAGLGTPQLYPAPRTTTFDDGPNRTRRQRLGAPVTRSIALTLTPAQLASFLAFCDGTLNGGAGRFTASIRLPGGTMGVRTCRIEGAPAETAMGAHSRVSFNLSIWNWI